MAVMKNPESWLSRKLFLVLLAMALIAAGGIYSVYSPVFLGLYGTFIGGILGACGLYFGGNLSDKWIAGKTNASVEIAKVNAPPKPSTTDLEQNGE